MNSWKKVFVTLAAVSGLFAAGMTAAATTQPAVAIPADWQPQNHSAAGLNFAVPPTWKAGDHTEESFYFLLPTSSRMSEDKVLIEMHPAKDEPLTKVVADAKQKIKADSSTKLVKDAADTLAGQPAWVLLSEKTYTNTLSEAAKPAPAAAKIAMPKLVANNAGRKLRTYQELCVANGKLFVLNFASDGATYEQQFANFKKVIATAKFADGSETAVTAVPVEPPADSAEPAGWTTVSQAVNHFDLSVPITWKKVIDEPTQLTFQLPRQQGLPGGDQLNLSFGACHAMSIKQMADAYRGDITKDPQQKLMQDEPTTLGGRPAWLFVAKDVHELRRGGGTEITKRDGMFLRVLTIDKDWQFMMTLDMDHAAVATDLPVMKQVVEKFKWTAPPRDPALATTQPS